MTAPIENALTNQSSSLQTNGWQLLRACYSREHLEALQKSVSALSNAKNEAVRERDGSVYAARNVLEICPQIVREWQTPELVEYVIAILGSEAGLVRALFFDKPPSQTWALPWHKDRLIAVADDRQLPNYSRPRLRAGILHSEPPVNVLEQMLTLRIHLDPMTLENGPLEVLS